MLVDDLGVPLEALAAGASDYPVGTAIGQEADALEGFHEFGKVFEVSPEAEDFFGGAGDEDGGFDFVAGAIRDAGAGRGGGGDADGMVEAAMAGDAAHDEGAACEGEEDAREAATGEAGGDEGGAANDGGVAFGFTDVYGSDGALEGVAAKGGGAGIFGFERGVG